MWCLSYAKPWKYLLHWQQLSQVYAVDSFDYSPEHSQYCVSSHVVLDLCKTWKRFTTLQTTGTNACSRQLHLNSGTFSILCEFVVLELCKTLKRFTTRGTTITIVCSRQRYLNFSTFSIPCDLVCGAWAMQHPENLPHWEQPSLVHAVDSCIISLKCSQYCVTLHMEIELCKILKRFTTLGTNITSVCSR